MYHVVRNLSVLWLLGAVFAIGCGPSSTEVPEQDPGLTTSDLIKQDLQMVVDNGQLGSEMMSIKNNLEKLKSDDAAKAEELLTDLEELESLGSGPRVKSKAKEMIDKL